MPIDGVDDELIKSVSVWPQNVRDGLNKPFEIVRVLVELMVI